MPRLSDPRAKRSSTSTAGSTPPPAARNFDRLEERLAEKAQVDGIRPHPLRPRLFTSGSSSSRSRCGTR